MLRPASVRIRGYKLHLCWDRPVAMVKHNHRWDINNKYGSFTLYTCLHLFLYPRILTLDLPQSYHLVRPAGPRCQRWTHFWTRWHKEGIRTAEMGVSPEMGTYHWYNYITVIFVGIFQKWLGDFLCGATWIYLELTELTVTRSTTEVGAAPQKLLATGQIRGLFCYAATCLPSAPSISINHHSLMFHKPL
jgi:hypothetical protein